MRLPLVLKPSTALLLPTLLANTFKGSEPATGLPALYVADTLDGWQAPEALAHKGLLVPRPHLAEAFDALSEDIDAAHSQHFGDGQALGARVPNHDDAALSAAVERLLAKAALPAALSERIHEDACEIARAVGALCDQSAALELKLEVFGHNVCQRWHMDHFVGRAIVSYTGATGTMYTRDANVDFWELQHCGNNDCIIKDVALIENVGVGDILFIKGAAYSKSGATGLVHKSPEKRFHEDGRIVNRLVLKVDVMREAGGGAEVAAAAGARPGVKLPASLIKRVTPS